MPKDFVTQVQDISANHTNLEFALSKGLTQPFNNANSGSRKLMHGIHEDQAFEPLYGEQAIVETGYEIRFGDLSSSLINSDADYEVISIIPKFSFCPKHDYYIILRNLYKPYLKIIRRVAYKFSIEVYGYLYNNEFLDSLQPGSIIQRGTNIRKTIGYDKYGNRTGGKNLNTLYLADDRNQEDSIIILDEVAKSFAAPIFHPVKIIKNKNDIMLNLYGDDTRYKIFPDIGELIHDNVLCAMRREINNEAAFSQAYDRLKSYTMSDDKWITTGRVIDIDVFSNSPEFLAESDYNSQILLYHNEKQRFAGDIINAISPFINTNFELDYELQKIYYNAKQILSGAKYTDKNEFSDTLIKFMILEERPLEEGDKMADRYGGKGVVSYILPKELMPRLPDGSIVEIIKNQSTTYGRENIGQLFELSTTRIGKGVVDFIRMGVLDPEESISLIEQYYRFYSIPLADSFKHWTTSLNTEEKSFFLENILDDKYLEISISPINESITINNLIEIYDKFTWIKKEYLTVPIRDSNNNIRYVQSKRATVASKIYNFRLKQFAEEKFSATSLSSTNLTNLNSRSKASKEYKEPYSNTPVQFGYMETGNMSHLGVEYVVFNLMLHSLSPHARRQVEEMQTGDPYHVDIKLNSMARNRSVEILNAYTKTMGFRLKFIKVKKIKRTPITINPIKFARPPEAIIPVKDLSAGRNDLQEYIFNTKSNSSLEKYPVKFCPIKFYENIDDAKK